ncbi:MAG: hypothetical protein WDO14_02660 [Bacteroidota bacterium]
MRKITNMLAAFLFIGTVAFVASCSSDDPAKPAPTVTTTSSILSVIADTTSTVTLNISAAAGIKDIAVSLDNSAIGTVEITNKADLIGKLVGDATLKFTSTFTLGTGNITIIVTDNASLTGQAAVAVTVTDHPAIEIRGTDGTTGTKEYHITKATTWGPHLTYHVTSNVFVEKEGSLTLMEGTTVIVDGKFSFTVRGNFYSYGTATDSVVLTVPSGQRTKANIFGGLWGGVLSSNTDGTNTFAANELVVQYTRFEYTGMLGQAWQDIVKLGEVADTNTPEYALFFNNPTGICVIQNSTFAYSADVAVQVDQGKILITNNAFILNGKAGGEAIDTKVGTNGDIAYNLFYKTATNGVKYNAKGGSSDLRIYNNTAVECGWRQTSHSDHGGSFNAEQGAKGMLYNNLIVNCTRGVRFSNGKIPDVAHLNDGYNYHYSKVTSAVGTDSYTPQFYPADGFIIRGNGKTGPNAVDSTFETSHDVPAPKYTANQYDEAATMAAAQDPQFVNFSVTTFDNAAAVTAEEPSNEGFPAVMNFHLKAGSPALTGGKTTFSPYNTSALSAGGKSYSAPAPAAYFGAYGTN